MPGMFFFVRFPRSFQIAKICFPLDEAMANNDPNRRWFLSILAGLLMVVIGCLVAIPALGYCFAPLRRRSGSAEGGFHDVGPLADIPMEQWRLLSLEIVQEDGWRKTRARHSIWARRRGAGEHEITVLSSICPHLGCPINWLTDRSQFNCPCHGGIFDAEGRHTGGPPPRAMDPLDYEVRAGRLWVRWQEFKIGVADRVPVNV
jgi:menaquinol-cytochrome c reductase iron-sulfur subunit